MTGRVLVCTHHKTGTIWMRKTFQTIGQALGIPFATIRSKRPPASLPPSPAIVLDIHSYWRGKSFKPFRVRADRLLHVIRDPRDVVISAAHYHATSTELWLHRPNEALGGRSYQQAINALPDGEERLRFEMLHKSGSVIRQMLKWNYRNPRGIECTYEALMADASCDLFGSIALRLGLDEAVSRRCFWDSSLFGGLAEEATLRPNHVRSGAPRQWERVFTQSLAHEFTSLFGDALIRLGYEADHSWIDRLPEAASAVVGEAARA